MCCRIVQIVAVVAADNVHAVVVHYCRIHVVAAVAVAVDVRNDSAPVMGRIASCTAAVDDEDVLVDGVHPSCCSDLFAMSRCRRRLHRLVLLPLPFPSLD